MPSKPYVVGMMSPSLLPRGIKVSRSTHDLFPDDDSLRMSSSIRDEKELASSYACPWLFTEFAFDKRRELITVRVTAIPIMMTQKADTSTRLAPLLDFKSDTFSLISSPGVKAILFTVYIGFLTPLFYHIRTHLAYFLHYLRRISFIGRQ